MLRSVAAKFALALFCVILHYLEAEKADSRREAETQRVGKSWG